MFLKLLRETIEQLDTQTIHIKLSVVLREEMNLYVNVTFHSYNVVHWMYVYAVLVLAPWYCAIRNFNQYMYYSQNILFVWTKKKHCVAYDWPSSLYRLCPWASEICNVGKQTRFFDVYSLQYRSLACPWLLVSNGPPKQTYSYKQRVSYMNRIFISLPTIYTLDYIND